MVRRSPLPQYCAPRIEPALVTATTLMFCPNCIWVASATAAMESWATRPSITASPAATAASIRLCSAMGSVSRFSFA